MRNEYWDVLVLDLDGTLLCGQGNVSDQNIHALDAVRESGVEVVVATGRCFAECSHILDLVEHDSAVITAGGSKLTDMNGATLERETLEESVVQDVTKHVLEGNLRSLLLKDSNVCGVQYVLIGDAPLHPASTWWFESLNIPCTEVKTFEDDPWPTHTLRVGAVAHEEQLLPIANQLEVVLKDRAKLQHWSAVTSTQATGSTTHLLEIFGARVSKWSMLENYLGKKLCRERTAAIGDGLNDIEVLREVGLSIVMKNADDNVKEHADVLAGHHNEHGFADAMRRWIIK